jgi:hypothetical protein
VYAPRIVLVDRDLVGAAPDDAPFPRRNGRFVLHLAGRDVIAELERDVGVLLRERAELARVQRDALRVELLRPVVRPTLEQRREQQAGDRAVRHPHPGVAGRDPHVLGAVGVLADEREIVVRLEHLA